jgi:hypothetical protein
VFEVVRVFGEGKPRTKHSDASTVDAVRGIALAIAAAVLAECAADLPSPEFR